MTRYIIILAQLISIVFVMVFYAQGDIQRAVFWLFILIYSMLADNFYD